MKVVFLSGTYIQAPEGKPELRLGPGSYMMQPGGNYRHTTSCDKASECLFFVESNGEFDLKPVEARSAPAKKKLNEEQGEVRLDLDRDGGPLRNQAEEEEHFLHLLGAASNPEFVILVRELQIDVGRTDGLQRGHGAARGGRRHDRVLRAVHDQRRQ